MKTAYLQCFQQFSSENKENVYRNKIINKFKITVQLQNCAKRSF